LLVGTLLWLRLSKPLNAKSRAHPVLALAVVVLVALGTVWTLLGPLQPGWAAANNGTGSRSTSNALTNSSQQQITFPQTFTGDLQGQYTQNGPDANGNVTLQFELSISNGPSGNVQGILRGQSGGGDDRNLSITSSQVTLLSSSGQQLFTGSLNNIYGNRRLSMMAMLTGMGTNSSNRMQVLITVRPAASGQVTGTIAAGSAIPSGDGVPE
jgi:hypothetical protein